MDEITYTSKRFYEDLEAHPFRQVHLILIATKPDIIKQLPLYRELSDRSNYVILGHTGQHYDENLSGGMLKEFDAVPDFNLNVKGEMHEVVSQIIGRLGYVIGKMKDLGKVVIPYVHGDTTTAMAASNAAYCHGFPSVHVEAGIRTLTPKYFSFDPKFSLRTTTLDMLAWRKFLFDPRNYERGSSEPYPEQFNTRASEAASGIHLASVDLDRDFLLSEGYALDRIFVVGNSVVDATRSALKESEKSTIFDTYPQLKGGNFVRFCVHRRENCMSETRFHAIFDAMKRLVMDGRMTLLISMFQTEAAFDRFGLRGELDELKKQKNFLYSAVWPEYGDVIAAMSRAAVCATDSGSMQEEMNVLGVPCVTLRFGSDRSESIMAGGNIIAPPLNGDLIKAAVEYAWDNAEMRNAPKIYGEHVSKKCIDAVERVIALEDDVMRSEEKRIGFLL